MPETGLSAAAPPFVSPGKTALRLALRIVFFLSLLTVAMGLASMLLGSGPFWGIWEDSFMLVRYANNLLHGHGLIWNPGGAHTYGLTSVFYIFPVAAIQAMVPGKPILSLA